MNIAPRRAFSVAVFCRRASGPDEGRILLIKHKRLGTWLPVGGEMLPGETPLEAAKRELAEETGLQGRFEPLPDAVDGAPPGFVTYEEHAAGTKGLHLNFCFVADVDDIPIKPCDEFDEFQFVDALAVDDVACPANVSQLVKRAALGGRPSGVLVARRWLAAFNDHDLDRLVGLYALDAVHVSPKLRERRPETRGEIVGHDALRSWWADAFARMPSLHYEEKRIVAEGDCVFLEYVRQAPGEAPLVVAELYQLDTAGKIARSHVFHG
jgi:8-oxo-dGTP diphosphatase